MKKALVVDDNEGIRRLLHEALTLEGYSVDTAANGSQALAAIQEHIPAVVLLDSKMPGMNGLDVLSKLSDSHPNLPVIVITAYSDQKEVKAALENGLIRHHLAKPFCLADLSEMLHLLETEC